MICFDKSRFTMQVRYLFCCSLIAASLAYAQTTYYISSSTGNNANDGTSPAAAWQTLDKIFSRSLIQDFQPGDSILLKRGDTFDGQIRVTLQGEPESPIVIGAYDTGARPIIYGDLRECIWTAIAGRTGYYIADAGKGTVMSYAYQWVDGEWKRYSNIQYKGTSPSQHEEWLDSLGEGEWGISYTQDTLWVHTYGSIAMPVSRDSIRFVRRYNHIAAGSHDAVIRDLDLRNNNYGLDVASSTNITARNISTKNTFSGGIYLSQENTDCLVDSCDIDSVGNTALYNRTGSSCIFRYNSISNVVPLIDGITTTGDQAGLGSQGSYTNGFDYSIGQHNTYEYNTLTNVLNGAIDFYWNIGDTIRYNTGIDVGTGGSPHGKNIVFMGNDMSGRTGAGQGFNGSNIVNKGYGNIIYTNNVLRNVSDYGIRVSSNDSGGAINISNNMVVMRSTGGNSFVNFITVNGVTSTCNTYVGTGVFRAEGVTYSTLPSFYAATGLDSCSVWYSDTSGVEQDSMFNLAPPDYVLKQNYPNPFNVSTKIEFGILNAGLVSLKVFDVLGREVATLVNEEMKPGSYERVFNARNLSSGVYLYRLQIHPAERKERDIYVETKKLLLLR